MGKSWSKTLKFRAAVAILACFQLVWPSRLLAAGANPGSLSGTQPALASSPTTHQHHNINFDLSSTTQNVNASHLLHNNPTVNILVNGQSQIVTPTSVLTRAEAVAVTQILRTGAQSLQIGAAGNAIGGSLTISSQMAQHIANLVIPQGVTAIDKFMTSSTFSIAGNLTNAGSMYAVSLNPNITSVTISSLNISNLTGGLISTNLPANLGAQHGGAPLNLTLTAINNITNAGTIASSGNLNVNAGGSITNALPTGITASPPVMQAANNLTLISGVGNIVNSGLIAATAGNLQITTPGSTLNINGVGGTFSALNEITVSTQGLAPTASPDGSFASLTVQNGTFSAQAVSFDSPQGDMSISTTRIDGDVIVSGGSLILNDQQGNLNLAGLHLTGDPSLTVAGTIDLVSLGYVSGGCGGYTTGGADFYMEAGKDIVSSGITSGNHVIDATGGGTITLIAGSNGSGGASACGGSIILPYVSLQTSSNNITLTAHAVAGHSAGSISINNINTSGGGGSCASPGQSGGSAGNITINAGGNISTGSLQAYGGGGAGGEYLSCGGQVAAGSGGGGGTIYVKSAGGSVTVNGAVNSSGGGGGGAGGVTRFNGPGTQAGGAGGCAGNITILAFGVLSIAGPVLAVGGGAGGCNNEGYGGGGGGSFGGGGGGGAGFTERLGQGSSQGGGGGGGYFGGSPAGFTSCSPGPSAPGAGGGFNSQVSTYTSQGVTQDTGVSNIFNVPNSHFGEAGNGASYATSGTNAGTSGANGSVVLSGNSFSNSDTVNSSFGFSGTYQGWSIAGNIVSLGATGSGQTIAPTGILGANILAFNAAHATVAFNQIASLGSLADFTLVSSGDLNVTGCGTIDRTNASGAGKNVTLAAGVAYSVDQTTNTFTMNGASSTGGSLNACGINIRTNSGCVNLQANEGACSPGNLYIGNVETSGAGGRPGYVLVPASGTRAAFSGCSGGDITIAGDGVVNTGYLRAYGGGGGGGGNVTFFSGCSSTSADNGGAGGKGGNITVSSTNGCVTIGGDVNTSGGGGGGGGKGSSMFSPPTFGGAGGAAGCVSISAHGDVTISGPVLSESGSSGTGSSGFPHSSGGGSFGGGGGGGGNQGAGCGGPGGGGFFGGGGGGACGGGNSGTGGTGGGIFGGGAGGFGCFGTAPCGSRGNGSSGATFGSAAGFEATAAGAGGGGKVSLSGNTVSINGTITSYFSSLSSNFTQGMFAPARVKLPPEA